MLDIVLEGLQPRILDKIDVKFECECCKDKVQEALVAIGKTALSQIIEEDKQAEVGCQFCTLSICTMKKTIKYLKRYVSFNILKLYKFYTK